MHKVTFSLLPLALCVAGLVSATRSAESKPSASTTQGSVFLPGHWVNFGHIDSLTGQQEWPYGLNTISTKIATEVDCDTPAGDPCAGLYDCAPRRGYWTFRYYTSDVPKQDTNVQIDRGIDVYFQIAPPPSGENAAIEGVDFVVCTSNCDATGLPAPVSLGNGMYRIRVPDSGTLYGANGNNIWVEFVDDGDDEEPEAFLIRLLRAEVVGTNFQIMIGNNEEARWLIVDVLSPN